MPENVIPAPPPPAPSGKKILAIEDDRLLLKVYQVKLEREGFEVWNATDGTAAMELVKGAKVPDLVLLDLMLPGMSGFDLLAEIRKSKNWKDVPVIVLSNLGQSSDIARCKELGANDYVVKTDTKIADLVQRIRKFI